MNWLLFLVLFILIINIYAGYKKGLLKQALSLVAWVAIVVFAVAGTPTVSSWLSENTGIEQRIESRIVQSDAADNSVLQALGVYEKIADKIGDVAMDGLSFFVIVLAGVIIYKLLNKLFGIANKIPIIGGVNKSAGGAVGLIKGCLVVWIGFAVVALNSASETGILISSYIYDSKFLMAFYENNLVLSTLLSIL